MFARVVFDDGGDPELTKQKITEEIQSCARDEYVLIDVRHIDDIITLYFEDKNE